MIGKLFEAGGVVMYPLLLCSVLTIALTIERVRYWLLLSRQQRLVREVFNLYRLNNVVGAISKVRQNANLPIMRIFLSALTLEKPTPDKFRLALESEAQAEIPGLRRFNDIFESIAGLGPLLGLLGTILGLIRSFQGLNIGDVGGTKTIAVTAGISEALFATACGMIVAILALLAANTFRSLFEHQIAKIHEYGGQLEILYLDHQELDHQEEGEKSYAS
jgi:biopolymer transport protein ExbB